MVLSVDPARIAAVVAETMFPNGGHPTWEVLSPYSARVVIHNVFAPGAHPTIVMNGAPARAAIIGMGAGAVAVDVSAPDMGPTGNWVRHPTT